MVKKLLVSACFVVFCLFGSQAQTVKATVGIKGMGIATMPNTELEPTTKVQFGGGGGAFAGMLVGKTLGIQAEALYSYQMASFNYDNGYRSSTYKTTKQYVHIPVCLQLWCGRNFAFEFGYEQAIAMSGHIDDGDTVRPDAGILDYGSLVGGMVINMGKVVFLNIRYVHALQNSYVMMVDPSKAQSLQVSLGFRFYTSRKSVFK